MDTFKDILRQYTEAVESAIEASDKVLTTARRADDARREEAAARLDLDHILARRATLRTMLEDMHAAAAKGITAPNDPAPRPRSTERERWVDALQVGDRVGCLLSDGQGNGEIVAIRKYAAKGNSLVLTATVNVRMDADVAVVGGDVLPFSPGDLYPIPEAESELPPVPGDPDPDPAPTPPAPVPAVEPTPLVPPEVPMASDHGPLEPSPATAPGHRPMAFAIGSPKPKLISTIEYGGTIRPQPPAEPPPMPDTAAQAVAQLEAGLPVQPQLPSARPLPEGTVRRVLAHFAAHASEVQTPLQVATALGWTVPSAHTILGRMAGNGQIRRLQPGKYVSLTYRPPSERDPVQVAKTEVRTRKGSKKP